eukprot:SAG11_NODE_4635_length_1825_cov_21.859791_1_plen_224_part_10
MYIYAAAAIYICRHCWFSLLRCFCALCYMFWFYSDRVLLSSLCSMLTCFSLLFWFLLCAPGRLSGSSLFVLVLFYAYVLSVFSIYIWCLSVFSINICRRRYIYMPPPLYIYAATAIYIYIYRDMRHWFKFLLLIFFASLLLCFMLYVLVLFGMDRVLLSSWCSMLTCFSLLFWFLLCAPGRLSGSSLFVLVLFCAHVLSVFSIYIYDVFLSFLCMPPPLYIYAA